jgi:hypothetical protein
MNFKSDFSLFPIKKLGNPNWEYRKATWPAQVDQEVHKIYEGKTTDPVFYTRTTIHEQNPRTQYCKVSKKDNDIIMEPGDGYNFLVRRDSMDNKELDDEIDDDVVPHDMKCVICLDHKRTYAVPECGHVSLCFICAKHQFETRAECPICRTKMSNFPIKLFFS